MTPPADSDSGWMPPAVRGASAERLRVAWRRGLEAALAARPNEVTPYKILPGAYDAVKEVVSARLKLFSAH